MKYITISHAAHLLGVNSRQAVEHYVTKGDLNPIWISKEYKGAVRVFDIKQVEKIVSKKKSTN